MSYIELKLLLPLSTDRPSSVSSIKFSASSSWTTQLLTRELRASPTSGLHSISAWFSTMFLNYIGFIPSL